MKEKNSRQQRIRTKRASEKLCDADSNKRHMGNTGKCGAGNGMRNFPSPEATINHRQAPGHISIYELLAELIFLTTCQGLRFWSRTG